MNPVTSSGDLVRRAQSGDHRAFTSLVRDCDDKMRRLAYRLLGSQTAMDDALQDAYLTAYGRRDTYDGRAAFSTWRPSSSSNLARRAPGACRETESRYFKPCS